MNRHAPVSTGREVKHADGARYVVFSDGSYRRWPVKLRGKARVKAAKRTRGYVNGERVIS